MFTKLGPYCHWLRSITVQFHVQSESSVNLNHRTFVVFFLLVAVAWLLWPFVSGGSSSQVLIPLKSLPGITQETLSAQGVLFRIEEPILFNPSTQVGVFVTEIVSDKNFGDETHITIGGDAQSLDCFRKEILFVNSGPSCSQAVCGGFADGTISLGDGLWQLVRHPLDSVEGLAEGVKNTSTYVWNANASDIQSDSCRLAKAFYYDKASKISEAHGLDYFDLKTDHGKDAIHSETNAALTGRGVMELALLLVPFSEIKFAGESAGLAKGVEAVNLAQKMAATGRVSAEAVEFAKAGRLFPQMVGKMVATLERLKNAAATSHYKPPVAKLGEAVSLDYRTTFFAANQGIDAASTVIHHAVEQQAMTRYPGVISKAEMHSLENLRGIPKALDSTLHKAEIAKAWNEFYRLNPASTMTKEKLLQKATEIDGKFGHLFTPQLF